MAADRGVTRGARAAIDVRRALLTALSIGGYLGAFWMYLGFAGGDLQTIGADLVAYPRRA
jgi:hypothetical protein